jgi:hypothetical protein
LILWNFAVPDQAGAGSGLAIRGFDSTMRATISATSRSRFGRGRTAAAAVKSSCIVEVHVRHTQLKSAAIIWPCLPWSRTIYLRRLGTATALARNGSPHPSSPPPASRKVPPKPSGNDTRRCRGCPNPATQNRPQTRLLNVGNGVRKSLARRRHAHRPSPSSARRTIISCSIYRAPLSLPRERRPAL